MNSLPKTERKKRRVHPLLLLSLLIIFLVIGWKVFQIASGMMKFKNYHPKAVTVSTVTVTTRSWHPHIDAVGNFVATNGVDVNSQSSGNVVKIYFESGEYVQKGAPLIDIDDSIDQAVLKNFKATLKLKELDYKRQTDLFPKGATSKSSVDESRANLDKAKADVEKTEAEILQKHITAPFSGVLGIRQVNLGQYVTPGQTTIVTLQALDPLYLDFYLPEHLYKNIHKDQAIQFSLEEFPKVLFRGKISAINSKVDIKTHNIKVQATLPNCPEKALKDPLHSKFIQVKKDLERGKLLVQCDTNKNTSNKIEQFLLLPGMFATLSVEQPPIPNVIVLPSTAISYSLYGNAVYVLEKRKDGQKNQDGKEVYTVNRQFITIGEQQGNLTVITKGLKQGQLVVSSGEIKLQNGMDVVINNDIPLNTSPDLETLGQ